MTYMKIKDKTIRMLFAVYLVLMLWLMFGQRMGKVLYGVPYFEQIKMNTNLIPFKTIMSFIVSFKAHINDGMGYMVRFTIVNLLGNILMFIPLGWYVSYFIRRARNVLTHILICTAIIAAAEAAQLFSLLGSFDVDDFILNLIGTLIGWGVYRFVYPKRRKRYENNN